MKGLCEDDSITKVIHNTKMDSDALYHNLDVRLCNVHGTQVWDIVLKNHHGGLNLNDTLSAWRLPPAEARDKSVYSSNPTSGPPDP